MCGKRKSVVFRPKCVIFSHFRVNIQLFLNPKNFMNVKFGFPAHFYPQKGLLLGKNSVLATFNTSSLNQGSVCSKFLKARFPDVIGHNSERRYVV